jgi:hypothetical protein
VTDINAYLLCWHAITGMCRESPAL